MDIIVKGRHTAVSAPFRDYAYGKLAKVHKLDPKVMTVDVEVSKERNRRMPDHRERVELTCHSRGPAIRAEAAADDRYAALDQALARLKERLRKLNDRRKVHRGSHTPESVAQAAARGAFAAEDTGRSAPPAASRADVGVDRPAATSSPAAGSVADTGYPVYGDPADGDPAAGDPAAGDGDQAAVPLETEGEAPVVVREKVHRAEPMTLEQALFEMELVGHDFFLFRDRDSGRPSVAYRRRAFDYGVLRLEE